MIAATQRITDGENAAASGRRRHPLKSHMATVKSGGHGLLPARAWLTALWTVCRFFGGGQPRKLFTRSNWLAEWRLYWVTSCWPRPPSNMGIHPVLNNSEHVLANNSGDLFKFFQMQWGNKHKKKKVAHTASYIIECIIACPSQLHSYKKQNKNPDLYSQALRNQSFLLSARVPGSFHPSLSLSLPV